MQFGAYTDKGKIRENNQDFYYISEDMNLPLFIVADGMGGHKAGEVASSMAVEIVKDYFIRNVKAYEKRIEDLIREAIDEANTKIYKSALENAEYYGMGTTMTLAYLLNEKLFIGHIGDSRAYLIRENQIIQLTEDHSLVAELVKQGSISKKEAQYHPQKNIITRAVGTSEDISTDIIVKDIKNSDIIFLCTDGLTNMIDEDEIKNMLTSKNTMQEVCNSLVDKANDSGGLDNITAVAVKIV